MVGFGLSIFYISLFRYVGNEKGYALTGNADGSAASWQRCTTTCGGPAISSTAHPWTGSFASRSCDRFALRLLHLRCKKSHPDYRVSQSGLPLSAFTDSGKPIE